MPVGLGSTKQIRIGCNIRLLLRLVNNLLAAESRNNRYCARGIPSAGSPVVFAQMRRGLRSGMFEHGTLLLSQGHGANFGLKSRRRFPPTSTYDKSALSI